MTTISLNPAFNQPIAFKAVWTEENKHLKEGLSEKVTRYVFFILNTIATMSVIPALCRSQKKIREIDQDFERRWNEPVIKRDRLLAHQFTRTPIEVTTPDGVKIHGTWFKNTWAYGAWVKIMPG